MPTKVGGHHGGEKYFHMGIFFKFTLDKMIAPGQWFYGSTRRNDEKAMKAACNELKVSYSFTSFPYVQGLSSYFQCRISQLHFPFMALIHYRGYCLLAESHVCGWIDIFFLRTIQIEGIGGETLIYGSADAGRTVHADHPTLNKLMEKAGSMLNLAPHLVSGKTIYGPGDIEVHLSKIVRSFS